MVSLYNLQTPLTASGTWPSSPGVSAVRVGRFADAESLAGIKVESDPAPLAHAWLAFLSVGRSSASPRKGSRKFTTGQRVLKEGRPVSHAGLRPPEPLGGIEDMGLGPVPFVGSRVQLLGQTLGGPLCDAGLLTHDFQSHWWRD